MAVVQWARRFTCDGCQIAVDVVEPWAEPEEWTNVTLGFDAVFWNVNLCSKCSTAPFSHTIELLQRRFDRNNR